MIVFPLPQKLPLRVITLDVPTLSFLRCLLDSPQWPGLTLLPTLITGGQAKDVTNGFYSSDRHKDFGTLFEDEQSTSGIEVEMIQAADDKGTSKICDLAAAINRNGKVFSYWKQSFIVCLYKGKGMHGKGESNVV